MIGCPLTLRNFERAAQHHAPDLRRETRHDVLKPGCHYRRVAAKQPFEDAHGRIEHSVMTLEELDELAHFGFVRREFARVLGDLYKAVAVARLLDLGKQKIQFDEIEMLDFIRAVLDELA